MRVIGSILAGTLLLAATPHTASAQRASLAQCSSNQTVLISKDVGPDRWAISYRPSTGATTGNVYTAGGGAIFLQCERSSITNGQVNLSCATSGGCSDTTCPRFEPIGSSTAIPCSFFTAPCSKSAGPSSSSATCSGSPARPPYDSEQSCESFATKHGCYQYTYSPGRCAVEICCSQATCENP